MATIRQWLKDEWVTHIWFPEVDADCYGLDNFVGVPSGVHRWTDPAIQPWLDVEFTTGLGTAHVPFFEAWSPTRVYFVHEYDGATSCHSVARDPNAKETE